ncbi:MAG: peptide-methionine (S)-S-oxide reductase MsrA [Salibacteraceae bacterium]|nr:peptide-methionine (S)-S-oxide reductase MsrA [Salibacteraceae bacterium]MDP4686200.1 peptide-methionine (S)-S-oxide reductase MsrA [Salibacteraceae bacterium]MDP4762494.1 peptide-methionine (S)-S-oxide reductase MsrA [Salibacteraceae bacterium]
MKKIFSSAFMLVALLACANTNEPSSTADAKTQNEPISQSSETEKQKGEAVAYFASGCFWCVEEVFESLIGVREVISGYAGGSESNPTYEQVGAGKTTHAESVMIFYDPTKVSFETLVAAYYASHDPTTANRQGPDAGRQYRSIAFYSNDSEKEIITSAIENLSNSGKWDNPIVTEVKQIEKFWPAEDYHQDYVKHNPDNSYVRNVSIPRFEKFRSIFDSAYLKK